MVSTEQEFIFIHIPKTAGTSIEKLVGHFDVLEKRGIEPVPVKYSTCWDAFNSGMDCSDAEIWREND